MEIERKSVSIHEILKEPEVAELVALEIANAVLRQIDSEVRDCVRQFTDIDFNDTAENVINELSTILKARGV